MKGRRSSYARFVSRPLAGTRSVVPVTSRQAERNLVRSVSRLTKLVKPHKPETKSMDLDVSAANIPASSGTTVSACLLAQGLTIHTRVGNWVRVTGLEFHCELLYTGGAGSITTDTPNWRVYIVQDLQQVPSTSPAVSDLVDQPSLPVVQLLNFDKQRRFKILYDSGPQLIWFGGQTVVQPQGNVGKTQAHFKRMNLNIPVEYTSTTTTSIQKNGLYVMYSTDASGAAAAAVLDANATVRVFFVDP